MAICVPSIRQQQRGCNAHIVRLAEYQAVKKNDPRGVEIRKLLILRQTNNVCVAPPAPQRPCTPSAPAPPAPLRPCAPAHRQKAENLRGFSRNQSQTDQKQDKLDQI